jgi:hypothetical protein
MFFKKKIPFQEYCTASLRAAFENTDEATGELFRRNCGDSFLSAAELQLYLNYLRAAFINLMLIAIAKKCKTDISLEAHIFVTMHLKELNRPELNEICHGYSQAFASSSTDGVRAMVQHFNKAVTAGRMRQETIERLYVEFWAVLQSHSKDFKSIKLVAGSQARLLNAGVVPVPPRNTEGNHFILTFDDKTLRISINGKLIAAYPSRELAPSVTEILFRRLELLIRRPDKRESFEECVVGFQLPSIGPCTICERQANLLGGLCYGCLQGSQKQGA